MRTVKSIGKHSYRISTGLRLLSDTVQSQVLPIRLVEVECLAIKACYCLVIRPAACKNEHTMSFVMDSINLQVVDV